MKVFITPKITTQNNYKSIEYSLETNWYKFAKKLNLELEIIDIFDRERWPKGRQNIIFSGGNDLYKVNKTKINKLRDTSEYKFFKFCLRNKSNIIGVCRGLQLISSYYKSNIRKIDSHVRKNHYLKIENSEFISARKINVNSFHNYGIRKLKNIFNVVAKTPDGVIEIAEHKKQKILLMNFHPERTNKSQKLINQIVHNFFK